MKRLALCAAVLVVTSGQAKAGFFITAAQTDRQDMSDTLGRPMNIAWHPTFAQSDALWSYAIIIPVIAAAALIGLIALCIWKPTVVRVIARIFSVLASGAGVTGIVAGVLFLALGTTYFEEDEVIWILAGGSGLLAGGIIALVLSFVGRRKTPV